MSDPSPVSVLSSAFVAEARDASQIPVDGPPEVAIAGRSNVGKSTLLNRLAGRHALARVSKTPGRTRGLVLFDLDIRVKTQSLQRVRLVDLPGYGYAQVSRNERQVWQAMVEGYLKKQSAPKLVLVLVDARRELGAEELQLMEWLQVMHVPCHLVVTKSDKLRASERGTLRERLRKEARAGGATVSLVSGQTGDGVDELWLRVAHALLALPDAQGPIEPDSRKGDAGDQPG